MNVFALALALVIQTPNDSLFPNQWGLAAIRAPEAWDITTGSYGVVVAIVDSSGVLNHNDVADHVLAPYYVIPEGSGNQHGLSMASVLGSTTNNALGMAGVCWQVTKLPVRAGTDAGLALSNGADGLSWASRQAGVEVVECATSFYRYTGNSQSERAVRRAQLAAGRRTNLVEAAGNWGTRLDVPNAEHIIVVSGVGLDLVRHPNSSYGPSVDLCAPIGSMLAAQGGGHFGATGTSVASAYVAGVFALVAAANPSLSPAERREIVYSTALDLGPPGWDEEYGWGLVNAHAAVQAAVQ